MSNVEIDSIDMQMDSWEGEEIDGILRLIEHRDGIRVKHLMPFRTSSKGGQMNPSKAPPYIWLWENPKEPPGQLSLHPSYKSSTVHILVDEGQIISIED